MMLDDLVKEAIELLPLFFQWVGILKSKGKDPRAIMEAEMNTAEAVAEAAEKAKFG